MTRKFDTSVAGRTVRATPCWYGAATAGKDAAGEQQPARARMAGAGRRAAAIWANGGDRRTGFAAPCEAANSFFWLGQTQADADGTRRKMPVRA